MEECETEFCCNMKEEDVKACTIRCEEVWIHKIFDELLDDMLNSILIKVA